MRLQIGKEIAPPRRIRRFSGINQGTRQFRIVMNILAFGIGNLGGPDLLIILLIVFVLFGAKKLPDLARSLGQSMNEFRKARQDLDDQLHNAGTQPIQPPPCQQVASVPGAQQVNSAPRVQSR
jgi:sec-independent protein translocase protein TatA